MADASEQPSFEDALAELDRILRALEDGTTTLEDALARYERGVGLLKQCYGQLRSAESRIRQLGPLADDAPGLDLSPFGHTAAAEKPKPPPKRRPPAGLNGDDGELPF